MYSIPSSQELRGHIDDVQYPQIDAEVAGVISYLG